MKLTWVEKRADEILDEWYVLSTEEKAIQYKMDQLIDVYSNFIELCMLAGLIK